MSKLDDFILTQERRHSYIVSEIQKSEQRTIDELKAIFEPRIASLEHSRTSQKGVLTGLSIAWGALVSAVIFAFQNQEKIKGLKP